VRADSLLGLLFVVYCLEAGLLFALAPWSTAWDRAAIQLPWAGARSFALHPLVRGVCSGFGVLHLLWGAHDIEAWLTRRRRGL
jgi:hypothetical protein